MRPELNNKCFFHSHVNINHGSFILSNQVGMCYIYLYSFEDSRTLDHKLHSDIVDIPFECRNIHSIYIYIPLDKTVRNIYLDMFRCNSIQKFLEDIPDNQSDGRNNDSMCSHILVDKDVRNTHFYIPSYNSYRRFHGDILDMKIFLLKLMIESSSNTFYTIKVRGLFEMCIKPQ